MIELKFIHGLHLRLIIMCTVPTTCQKQKFNTVHVLTYGIAVLSITLILTLCDILFCANILTITIWFFV
jgi:hypothetical protein